MFIAIDFDGTCVTNNYPAMGGDIGAVPVLLELVKKEHKLILLTNRWDKELKAAELWFNTHDIPLFGINRNPVQWKFTKSSKVYANYYIDDAAIGCPLKEDKTLSKKPFADWVKIREILIEKKIL